MQAFIACVGHASVDHHFEIDAFPSEPTKTLAKAHTQIVGGMAANAAIALSRLGAEIGMGVHLYSRVGDDPAGLFVQQAITNLGIQNHVETVVGGQTSVSSVVVDQDGERQIFNHRGNALDKAHALDTHLLQGASAVLVDPRWPQGAEAALKWARQNKVLSMLDADVAPREVLNKLVSLADWVVFSQHGLRCYAPQISNREALQFAINSGAACAGLTLGNDGIDYLNPAISSDLKHQNAFEVKALDTTGAGDVFHAALLLALSEKSAPLIAQEQSAAMRFACAAAAIKCTRALGALGAPSRSEVLEFLATNP